MERALTMHKSPIIGERWNGTSAKYYAEVKKMKLAELNTRFFKEEFDLILSGERLEKYAEEERRLGVS